MHSEGNNEYRKELHKPKDIEVNYYKVLGVSQTSSTADIKKAYHQLGKECYDWLQETCRIHCIAAVIDPCMDWVFLRIVG